jgi:hypothetical protein
VFVVLYGLFAAKWPIFFEWRIPFDSCGRFACRKRASGSRLNYFSDVLPVSTSIVFALLIWLANSGPQGMDVGTAPAQLLGRLVGFSAASGQAWLLCEVKFVALGVKLCALHTVFELGRKLLLSVLIVKDRGLLLAISVPERWELFDLCGTG